MIFQWIPQTIYMLSECSTPEAEPLPPTRPWSYRQQTSSGHPLPFHYTEDKHFPEKQGPELLSSTPQQFSTELLSSSLATVKSVKTKTLIEKRIKQGKIQATNWDITFVTSVVDKGLTSNTSMKQHPTETSRHTSLHCQGRRKPSDL